MLEATVTELAATAGDSASIDETAGTMIDGMSKEQRVTPGNVINFLRSDRINAFIAALSRHSGLAPLMVRRILFEAGGESLAVMCRGMEWQRPEFVEAFLCCRRAQGEHVTAPTLVVATLRFFDGLEVAAAQKMLRHWRRDPNYTKAIEAIDTAGALGARLR